jgi:hypothetical protein
VQRRRWGGGQWGVRVWLPAPRDHTHTCWSVQVALLYCLNVRTETCLTPPPPTHTHTHTFSLIHTHTLSHAHTHLHFPPPLSQPPSFTQARAHRTLTKKKVRARYDDYLANMGSEQYYYMRRHYKHKAHGTVLVFLTRFCSSPCYWMLLG